MSRRLFVGNLSHESSAEVLRAAFSAYGEVIDVQVISDRYSGRSRGFAFVTMATPEQAASAMVTMNGALVEGRPLRIIQAETSHGAAAGGMGFRGPR